MVAESAIAAGATAVVANLAGNALYDALTDDSKESNRLLAELVELSKKRDVQKHRSPELWDVSTDLNTQTVKGDFRAIAWLVSGAPGDTVGLKIGTDIKLRIITVSGDPVAIPLYGWYIAGGNDIESVNITTPGTAFTSHLLGTRE